MPDELDRSAYKTLPEQIAGIIRAEIERGQITAKVPNEDDLARRFGVARATVRNGLRILAGEGLIVRVPHRGTWVRSAME